MPAERWGRRRPDGLASRGAAAARRAHPSALRRQGRGQRPPAAVFPGHRSRGLPGRSWDRPAVAPRIAAAQGQQLFSHGEPGQGRVWMGCGEREHGPGVSRRCSPGVPSGGTERARAPQARGAGATCVGFLQAPEKCACLLSGWDPGTARIAISHPSSPPPPLPSVWFCVSFSVTNSVFHTRIEEMFW